MNAFDGLEDGSGRYSSSGKGCWGRMSLLKKVLLVFFIFVATFFIGFGIGFGAGNVAPPIVYQYLHLPAPPPPPPWFLQPPPPATAQWAQPAGYRKQPSVVLSGGASPAGTVGYMVFDANSSRLFVGLLADGLVALNTTNGTLGVPTRVASTAGCSGVVLAGALGFCGSSFAFWQGSNIGSYPAGITVVNLTSLAAVRNIPVANGVGVNTGAYDSTNQQVLMGLVNGSVAVLDARSGSLVKTVNLPGPAAACGSPNVPCDPFGDILVDAPSRQVANGLAFVAAPMMNSILRLDLASLAVTQTFTLTSSDCDIHGISLDSAGRRLFVGCGNPFNPSVITLDADSGAQIGSPVRIGRGVYSVKYDRARDHVYAASGVGANVAVIKAAANAPVNVREAVFTKPGARTLAFDPASGAIFTAAADGRFNPTASVNEDVGGGVSFFPNDMLPNTVEVMSFRIV